MPADLNPSLGDQRRTPAVWPSNPTREQINDLLASAGLDFAISETEYAYMRGRITLGEFVASLNREYAELYGPDASTFIERRVAAFNCFGQELASRAAALARAYGAPPTEHEAAQQ